MTGTLFDTTVFELGPAEGCLHKKGLRPGPPLDVADTHECSACGELVAIRLRYDAGTGTYLTAVS